MGRKLTFTEKKLLKKYDNYDWGVDNQIPENKVLSKFHISNREEYNKLSRRIRELVRKIKDLPAENKFRVKCSKTTLNSLYNKGLIPAKTNLMIVNETSASSFCRRRLTGMVYSNKMAETMELSVKMINQGHIRVGTEIVRDPAYLVPRAMEDYITWAPYSSYAKKTEEFNDNVDDYN